MASKSIIKVRIVGDNKDFKGSLDESEGLVGSWAGKVGKAAAVGLAAAGALGAAALAKGFGDALALQDNDALIGARLGVTPERAAELGDIASGAYRDAWGENLSEVTNVVTGLETSFEGLGNDQLDGLTAKAIALGDAFEIDTAQGIQTASEMVSSGLVSSADEAFDVLTRGLQEMPQAIRDELFAASDEYGDFFADLGLSGDEAFAKLVEYADDGIYGIDKFGDALKELTIRGTDMSDASVEAYEKAGLSAEDMAAKFLAGGDDAREALEDTAKGLLSIEDPVERANAAVALFGTPLEDLSVSEIPDFLDGLTDMQGGLGNVDGAAGRMADTLGGTTSAKLESFKREALGALADFAANELLPRFEQVVAWFETNWPEIQRIGQQVIDGYKAYWETVGRPLFDALVEVATSVVEWFRANWPQIQATIAAVFDWLATEAWPVVQQILGFIRTEFNNLVAWVRENWPEIRETIQNVIDAVRVIVETTIAVIQSAWETWGQTLIEYAQTAWETIKALIQAAVDIVRGIINTVTGLITGDWDQAWEGIRTILSGAWDLIKEIVKGAIETVRTILQLAWDAIGDYVSDTWDGITSAVSNGIDDIIDYVAGIPGRVASAIGNGFEAIWDSFRSVANRIIDGWNGLQFTMPSIDTKIPGVGRVGGFTVGVPDIPRLARGGVATSTSLAIIGEYAGARSNPEIVSPQSMMLDTVRQALREFGPSVGLQINGDVRLDDTDVDAMARRINFAMSA